MVSRAVVKTPVSYPRIGSDPWRPVDGVRWACPMSRMILSRDLAADGFSPGEFARKTRSGELTRLRRGAYAEPYEGEPDPRVAHLRLLEATVPKCDPSAVASHTSAGRGARPPGVAGATGAGPPDAQPTGRRADQTLGPGPRRAARRRRGHRGRRLPGHQPGPHGGGPRTFAAARRGGRGRGRRPVPAAARRAGDALDRQSGCTGIGRARRVVGLLDPRSESAGESYSRVVSTSRASPHLSRSTASPLRTGGSSGAATSAGRHSAYSGSSTARRSTVGCSASRARPPRTC